MDKSTSAQFGEVLTQALQLPPAERLELLEELAMSLEGEVSSLTPFVDDTEMSANEIAELMQVEPLSPAVIIQQGLLGTWADLNITDGAEWVNEQKRKRKERRKWSTA